MRADLSLFAPGETDWAARLRELTPVVRGERFSWKRDDAYAPPDALGVNGAKVRFLVWLLQRAVDRGARTVVTAGSVASPQIGRSAVVARHFGLPCVVILGGTRLETARRHLNVQVAEAAGAHLQFIPVGYNPALQKRLGEMHELLGGYRVSYGISVPDDSPAELAREFHGLTALQVANLPRTMETLIVPFGSGNSAASVLQGVQQYMPPRLRRIVLVGMGPDRMPWLKERCRLIGFELTSMVERVDLHAGGWTSYGQRVKHSIDGFVGHPTYEGKMLRWIDEKRPAWAEGGPDRVCIWIVGNERSLST